MMTPEEGWADIQWRLANDKPSRDQFERLVIGSGYLCECVCNEAHVETRITAEWMRPPMPEKRATIPFYVCAPCWLKLPETQEG
jgi:hypothetical protein